MGATREELAEHFAKHTKVKHECPNCAREIRGNGFANHKRWCDREKAIWDGILNPKKEGG